MSATWLVRVIYWQGSDLKPHQINKLIVVLLSCFMLFSGIGLYLVALIGIGWTIFNGEPPSMASLNGMPPVGLSIWLSALVLWKIVKNFDRNPPEVSLLEASTLQWTKTECVVSFAPHCAKCYDDIWLRLYSLVFLGPFHSLTSLAVICWCMCNGLKSMKCCI